MWMYACGCMFVCMYVIWGTLQTASSRASRRQRDTMRLPRPTWMGEAQSGVAEGRLNRDQKALLEYDSPAGAAPSAAPASAAAVLAAAASARPTGWECGSVAGLW